MNITFPDSCQDGDGHKAVWAIGGKKTGVVISADPQVPNPGVRIGPNTPWLPANQIKVVTDQPWLRVNELGKRFISEDMANNHTAMSSSMIRNNPNMASYMIFDDDTRKHLEEKVDYFYFVFPAEKLTDVRGQFKDLIENWGNKHVFMADTLEKANSLRNNFSRVAV